jgi:hypothetical protein
MTEWKVAEDAARGRSTKKRQDAQDKNPVHPV